MRTYIYSLAVVVSLAACSVTGKVSKMATRQLLSDSAIATGHIGISIYEPATGKYWYQHDAAQYFIPASNTKLFTLYTGLKYLGDSLPTLRIVEKNDSILLMGMGDPTLLHPEYKNQPVMDFLVSTNKTLVAYPNARDISAYGSGWGWDDYNEDYTNERSELPVFMNEVTFAGSRNNLRFFPRAAVDTAKTKSTDPNNSWLSGVQRKLHANQFDLNFNGRANTVFHIPFITSYQLAYRILSDTLHKQVFITEATGPANSFSQSRILRSRPVDSMFIPMMHTSDNFFAEHTLLMASTVDGKPMSDKRIIEKMLNEDLSGLPQRPKWVDGSGLSRYNLFSPNDMVYVLDKLKKEFPWERLTHILATGGEGTLKSYYRNMPGSIYAKTGTLSNNCALSGYIITKKKKLLIFSFLANNYITAATPVRRAVERFLTALRENY